MRSERKNDNLILSKLGEIQVDVAVIKSKAEATEEHLRTLNGKVQAHESRLQVQEGTSALNSQILAGFAERAKETRSFWERNWEKMFWTIFATVFTAVFAYIITHFR